MQRFARAFGNRAKDVRFYASEPERIRATKFYGIRQETIRPDSVYVFAIGVGWVPGAWQKVIDMVEYTNKAGVCCWFTEMADTNTEIPYTNLPTMRDMAFLYASDMGFQWVMLIENDALPEKDMIIKLIDWNMPVVVPLIMDKVANVPICRPQPKVNTGLKIVKWAPMTCLLMETAVLNCFPTNTPCGNMTTESCFYQRLRHYGHKTYIDTDTVLETARNPQYTGDLKSLDELWENWMQKDKKRRETPDRKPIDPGDKREVYYPWKEVDEKENLIQGKIS